ncbi:MAG: hypothetical protein AB7E79_07400 [Rhodospirillaceae bacterium]
MFDQSKMSTPSTWLFEAIDPSVRRNHLRAGILSRKPISRTPAKVAKMWTIGGPQGMSLEAAKQALNLRPGPEDLVIYSQFKANGCGYQVPHLISCQPYQH